MGSPAPLPPPGPGLLTPGSLLYVPPGLAPAFTERVALVLGRLVDNGLTPKVFVGLRTDQEQAEAFAHGYSRAADSGHSWHGYGLAVDIADAVHGWRTSSLFWKMLGVCAVKAGLTWGGDWVHFRDVAHVQWGGCPASPTGLDVVAHDRGGPDFPAMIWRKYLAIPLEGPVPSDPAGNSP